MTIRKGQDWGEVGTLAEDGLVVGSDAEIAAEWQAALQEGRAPREMGLLAGDLCQTVGGTGSAERLRSLRATRLVVDICKATLDGEEHWFVAHLVARRRFWSGPTVVAMNAEFIGTWRVAPAGHPNDGRVDLVTGELSVGDRLKARSRLASGTHVPHPDIRIRRLREASVALEPGATVYLDGRPLGRFSQLDIEVVPDALTVVV